MKIRTNWLGIFALILLGCGSSPSDKSEAVNQPNSSITERHHIKVESLNDTRNFYTWTSDRIPLVSAHRGGPYPGFPENAIETFENVLKYRPAIIELDVAMTQDSVLVLMHDDDLDRTTNGTGKVNEVTYDYIQTLFLEDNEGKLTEFKVPTLEEALIWSKGKALFFWH